MPFDNCGRGGDARHHGPHHGSYCRPHHGPHHGPSHGPHFGPHHGPQGNSDFGCNFPHRPHHDEGPRHPVGHPLHNHPPGHPWHRPQGESNNCGQQDGGHYPVGHPLHNHPPGHPWHRPNPEGNQPTDKPRDNATTETNQNTGNDNTDGNGQNTSSQNPGGNTNAGTSPNTGNNQNTGTNAAMTNDPLVEGINSGKFNNLLPGVNTENLSEEERKKIQDEINGYVTQGLVTFYENQLTAGNTDVDEKEGDPNSIDLRFKPKQ